MAERFEMNEAAARAAAMRKKVPEEQPPSVAEKINAMLPDWLSARSAVMKKRAQLRRMDQETREE